MVGGQLDLEVVEGGGGGGVDLFVMVVAFGWSDERRAGGLGWGLHNAKLLVLAWR